ncbi:MAG TPA: helix-turn-helix domain-containing protein [Acidimicrobiales bacterium]|nr:helix-turn-helix domain-containing protein [Acidimicrobiales bacterium]
MIIAAALRAFTKAGDVRGTTMKAIAREAKLSDGAIYKHFSSKDELYRAAVVEPLHMAMIRAMDTAHLTNETVGVEPVSLAGASVEDLLTMSRDSVIALTLQLKKMLPLLNLVLFGNPGAAQAFYKESYTPALDALADLIRATLPADRKHLAETSARMYFGQCLAFAIALRLDPKFDLDIAAGQAAQLRVFGADLPQVG